MKRLRNATLFTLLTLLGACGGSDGTKTETLKPATAAISINGAIGIPLQYTIDGKSYTQNGGTTIPVPNLTVESGQVLHLALTSVPFGNYCDFHQPTITVGDDDVTAIINCRAAVAEMVEITSVSTAHENQLLVSLDHLPDDADGLSLTILYRAENSSASSELLHINGISALDHYVTKPNAGTGTFSTVVTGPSGTEESQLFEATISDGELILRDDLVLVDLSAVADSNVTLNDDLLTVTLLSKNSVRNQSPTAAPKTALPTSIKVKQGITATRRSSVKMSTDFSDVVVGSTLIFKDASYRVTELVSSNSNELMARVQSITLTDIFYSGPWHYNSPWSYKHSYTKSTQNGSMTIDYHLNGVAEAFIQFESATPQLGWTTIYGGVEGDMTVNFEANEGWDPGTLEYEQQLVDLGLPKKTVFGITIKMGIEAGLGFEITPLIESTFKYNQSVNFTGGNFTISMAFDDLELTGQEVNFNLPKPTLQPPQVELNGAASLDVFGYIDLEAEFGGIAEFGSRIGLASELQGEAAFVLEQNETTLSVNRLDMFNSTRCFFKAELLWGHLPISDPELDRCTGTRYKSFSMPMLTPRDEAIKLQPGDSANVEIIVNEGTKVNLERSSIEWSAHPAGFVSINANQSLPTKATITALSDIEVQEGFVKFEAVSQEYGQTLPMAQLIRIVVGNGNCAPAAAYMAYVDETSLPPKIESIDNHCVVTTYKKNTQWDPDLEQDVSLDQVWSITVAENEKLSHQDIYGWDTEISAWGKIQQKTFRYIGSTDWYISKIESDYILDGNGDTYASEIQDWKPIFFENRLTSYLFQKSHPRPINYPSKPLFDQWVTTYHEPLSMETAHIQLKAKVVENSYNGGVLLPFIIENYSEIRSCSDIPAYASLLEKIYLVTFKPGEWVYEKEWQYQDHLDNNNCPLFTYERVHIKYDDFPDERICTNCRMWYDTVSEIDGGEVRRHSDRVGQFENGHLSNASYEVFVDSNGTLYSGQDFKDLNNTFITYGNFSHVPAGITPDEFENVTQEQMLSHCGITDCNWSILDVATYSGQKVPTIKSYRGYISSLFKNIYDAIPDDDDNGTCQFDGPIERFDYDNGSSLFLRTTGECSSPNEEGVDTRWYRIEVAVDPSYIPEYNFEFNRPQNALVRHGEYFFFDGENGYTNRCNYNYGVLVGECSLTMH